LRLFFAEKEFEVTICNTNNKEYGDYSVNKACCDGVEMKISDGRSAVLDKALVDGLDAGLHKITVELV